MKHRIVVLGAGYAGAYVAGTLARRLSPADTEITVVNAEPDFVQRLRLHQLAAGQEIEAPQLADVFAGTGIRLRLARVTAVDPERRSSPWPTPQAAANSATTRSSTRSAAAPPTTASPEWPGTPSTSAVVRRRCACASAWTA
ncbi:hypothetical protein GCM10020254_85470 [Streptomyces goshikiensis]